MTTLYEESNDERRNEYLYTLTKNLSGGLFEKIIVFFESSNEGVIEKFLKKNQNKIEIVNICGRPSFRSMFNYCDQNLFGKKVIISNADIVFGRSINLITKDYLQDSLIILTRQEKFSNKYKLRKPDIRWKGGDYCGCADSWVFYSPLKLDVDPQFLIGTLGCEKFCNNAIEQGITIKNPSLDIKTYHVHDSNKRNYVNEDIYIDYPIIFTKLIHLNEQPDYKKGFLKNLKSYFYEEN